MVNEFSDNKNTTSQSLPAAEVMKCAVNIKLSLFYRNQILTSVNGRLLLEFSWKDF